MYQVNYNTCNNIEEHYNTSLIELAKGYVPEYVKYLPHIREYMQECNSYRELGTNQGASASAVVLENVPFVQLIDKSFSRFRPWKHYFDSYAEANNIVLNLVESSSLEVNVTRDTDFLFVDSVHKYNHVLEELRLYSPFVNKYIMIHDTVGYPGVGKAVDDFVSKTIEWKLSFHYDHPKAGYTVLEKA